MAEEKGKPNILCLLALTALLLVSSVVSCHQKPTDSDTFFTSTLGLDVQKTTLEEASTIIGVTIPAPTYLPEGYQIQEVYLKDSTVILIISDKEIDKKLITRTGRQSTYQLYEFQSKMVMSIDWHYGGIPGGLKLPGEAVTIGKTRGKILDRSDHNTLWWQPRPDTSAPAMFGMHLSASKDILKEELIKVAESMEPMPLFPLKVHVALDSSAYLPGEDIKIEFSLKNVGPLPLQIEPFPPVVKIMRSGQAEAVWSSPMDTGARSLDPTEIVNYTLVWHQCNNQQQQVDPGYYYVEPDYIQFGRGSKLRPERLRLLIQYPQGAMEKTIEANQSQTVTGLPFIWKHGEKSIDLTITLRRVELSAEGAKFETWATSPQNPLPDFNNPYWMSAHAQAQYNIDGVIKEARNPGQGYGPHGVSMRWGYHESCLDPVPSDAKELIFTITSFGDWQGPWEFRVPLQ